MTETRIADARRLLEETPSPARPLPALAAAALAACAAIMMAGVVVFGPGVALDEVGAEAQR